MRSKLLSFVQDVLWLLSKLPNIMESWFDPSMDHLGYVWGLNAHDRVYKYIVRSLIDHEKNEFSN